MKKKHLVLALALAAAPFAASAADLSYTYVEGGYTRLDTDEDAGDFEFDGGQIRGSVAIADAFYLHGSYGRVSEDVLGTDVDVDDAQIGVGYRLAMGERADFIAELAYVRQEVDIDGFGDETIDGGRASVGVRGAINDRLEGYAKVNYVDGGDFDGDFSGTLGALVKFNPTWGLVAEVEGDNDARRYLVGVRASF
ncbi:MAG TPA: outer membrane beta-barrel protein [Lysobacter sp.]|nr:outer membrane beta-barrel protein [Lysobacter sp.]